MSRADIETLRAEYEAFSRRDWDAAFSEAHPDFELRPPESGPEAATVRGPDAARRAFADFFEPYDEVAVEPQQFFERGDRIVVFFLQRSRPRGSSATVEIQAGHLWTMRDGKAAGLQIFPEREKALEAADRLARARNRA
jgi:ketosteroid isomerase-like protein